MQGNAVCFAWEKEYNERKDWGMFLSKAGAKAALPDLTGTCAQQRVENDACPTEPWRRQCYRMRLFVSLKLSCSRNGKRCLPGRNKDMARTQGNAACLAWSKNIAERPEGERGPNKR